MSEGYCINDTDFCPVFEYLLEDYNINWVERYYLQEMSLICLLSAFVLHIIGSFMDIYDYHRRMKRIQKKKKLLKKYMK